MTDQPRRRKKTPDPPKRAVSPPALTKEEREKRNYRIFALYLAGNSEREISRYVSLSPQRVSQILQQEMKNTARHHKFIREEALSTYVARLETLIKGVWPKVIQGDLKAIEVGRRLLEQQANLYDIKEGSNPAIPPLSDQELADGDNPAGVDELTRYRMQHRRRRDEPDDDAADAADEAAK